MNIGKRLKYIRESKKLSQGDIECRTGLMRCYISRVENGYTVPSVETLEKFARAYELKTYQLLYDGEQPPPPPPSSRNSSLKWASHGKGARYMSRISRFLPALSEEDRELLLHTLTQMTARKRRARKVSQKRPSTPPE